jgi:hypothetical protein
MRTVKTISPLLVKAYRSAHYYVHHGDEVLLLKVGGVNHALAKLMKAYGASTATFLTAYNPHSEICSAKDNQAAHQQLLADLQTDQIESILGFGSDPADQWDPEESVLAFGLSLSQAEKKADQYGQNAFVWIANSEGFVNLKLRYDLANPTAHELSHWISQLPEQLRVVASDLAGSEQKWLLTVGDEEQRHWLEPHAWDLNHPWPIARPDGCAISAGTEMDRMFKLAANGLEKMYP